MKKNKKILQLSLMALLGVGLTFSSFGCQGDTQSKADPVVTKKIAAPTGSKAKPPVAKDALAPETAAADKTAKQQVSYQFARLPYDSTGKLDPFKPLFQETPKPKTNQAQKPKKPERPRTPLERLDLGQLQLTAIVFSEVRPRAMVEEDNGKGYVVQIGTPIGLERGQVIEIKRDRVIIEHLKTDDFGNSTPRRRELKLQKPPGD
jgi:type IV pilus assembly protein PilP